MKTYKKEDWLAEGERLFGKDKLNWKFKCPNCGNVQTCKDFWEAGITKYGDYVFFSCIGRFVKDQGCDWTLGGLFQIHKVEVVTKHGVKVPVFEFAE